MFWPSADNLVRTIVAVHEFGNTVVAALHIFTSTMEGGKQNAVAGVVRDFGSVVRVCGKGLLLFHEREIVLRLQNISLYARNEVLDRNVYRLG